MTLPVFRSATSGGDSSGTTLVVNTPAGVVEGDVLLVVFFIETSAAMAATGWTEISACFGANGGGGFWQRMFWYRAPASPPASHTFTWGGANVWRGYVCGAYIGAIATGTPVEAGRYDESEAGSATITGQSITTLGPDRKCIFAGVEFYSSASSFGNPNVGTRRGNIGALAFLCDDDRASAGATGNRTIQNNLAEDNPWSAGMLALIGVTGATYNLSAAASAQSATPDDVAVAVARAMAAQAAAASSTPTTNVLSVLRAMNAQAQAASLTPDTVTLTVAGLVQLAAVLSAQSATPDTGALNVLRALAAVSGSGSATPDAVSLSVLRALAATSLSQSATPDTVALSVLRNLLAQTAAVSLTPVDVRTTLGQFALRFYGNGTGNIDRVRIPLDTGGTSTPPDVGAGDFTIECRLSCLYADNTSGPGIGDARNSNIFMDRDIWGHERGWVAGVTRLSAPDRLVVCLGCSGGLNEVWETIYGSSDVGDDAWHHVAITWQQSTRTLRLWVDGVQEGGDLVLAATVTDLSYPDGYDPGQGQNNPYLVLGAEKHDAGAEYPSYAGRMEELRISDVRRYTTGFTPATDPFTADADAMGLYHMDDGYGAAMIDAATVNGAPTDGELLIGGTPSGPEWIASDAWAILLSAILSAVSVTPNTSALSVARAMAAGLATQSATPDTGALTVSRALAAASNMQSATPIVSMLSVARVLASGILANSATPDVSALSIARALQATLDAVSVTPDDATLSIAGLIELAATISAQSTTPDNSQLAILRSLAASLDAQSVTPDTVTLSIAGIIALAAMLAASSATPDTSILAVARPMAVASDVASVTPDTPVLSIARAMSAQLAGATLTPDVVVMIVDRALTASAQAQSLTPNVSVLAVQRLFAAATSAQSVTPDTAMLLLALAQGVMRSLFAARKPGTSFTGRKPGVDFDE